MKTLINKIAMRPVVAFGMAAGSMFVSIAAQAQTEYVYAQVLESRPIYQSVTVAMPRQSCWQEQVLVQESRRSGSRTPVLVSTIIGGAIGNAVGNNKSSQRVGTVVGAALGHSVGRDIVNANSRHQPARYQTVQHCDTVNEFRNEERLMGFQVVYRYNGADRTVQMDHDPGDRIQLRVQIDPVL
jgi:uncharacterized protein YcfJ